MLGIFAAMFVAALAVIIYSDAEPPEVSDLTVTPSAVPEAENFYLQLMELEKNLGRTAPVPDYWEPDDEPAGSPSRMPDYKSPEAVYDDFLDFLAAGKGWTPSRLARWDAALAKLAVDCEGLAVLKQGQAPPPTKAGSGDVPDRVGGRLCAAAGMYLQARESRRAMEIFELAYELGSKMKAARGPLNVYRAGMELGRCAIRGLRRVVAQEPELAPEIYRWWRGQRDEDSDTVFFADALRAQYSDFSFDLDAICAGGPRTPMPRVFEFCQKSRILFPLVLKPNLTKTLYLESLRKKIKWRDLPWEEFESRSGAGYTPFDAGDLLRPVNLYGRYILYENRYLDSMIWRRTLYLSEVSVFETSLALRLYHAEQGKLPASLAELVPAYFPSVPLDYQDGSPIRYSRDAHAVWSKGRKNLRIIGPDQLIARNEIVCRLDFAAPSAGEASPTGASVP